MSRLLGFLGGLHVVNPTGIDRTTEKKVVRMVFGGETVWADYSQVQFKQPCLLQMPQASSSVCRKA